MLKIKKQKTSNGLRFLRYVIIFIILFLGFVLFYNYEINIPLSSNANSHSVNLKIEQGESLKEIATLLKNEKIIKSIFMMRVYFKLNHLSKNIIADEFEIKSSMSIKDISHIITTKNIDEVKLRIIEGWNSKQIGEYLESKQICTKNEWLKLIQQDFDYEILKDKPRSVDLEGYLFPDTYIVYKDSGCENLLQKMLNNFESKIDEKMLKDIELQNKSVFEIITMASIIEKEVANVEDMKIVSGIFWDRIKNNQALESCATLAYILGENKSQYSYEDTHINSSYNTYRNRGLTPSPISNPGLNAIKAAVYPEYTNYNYFLTESKTGKTIFSKTFEEHKKNKELYLN